MNGNGKSADLWKWIISAVLGVVMLLAGRQLRAVDQRIDLIEHRQFEAQQRLSTLEAEVHAKGK